MDVRLQKGISNQGQAQDSDATTVFLAWEKLRFFFNAVLIGTVLVFLFMTRNEDTPYSGSELH
jgi:hypothetical protein